MKRTLMTAAILTALAGGSFALAQTPATNANDHAAHHPAAAAAAPKTQAPSPVQAGPGAGMGGGMMGGGSGMMGGGMCSMMGGKMMGGGMGGPGMAMLGGPNTKVDVKKTDKGVTITLTAPDAASAARLQKMAEAMRLMHEAMAQ
jgi:hypothetical protein